MNKMNLRDIEVTGKRALVRVDFNVTMDAKTGEITDDSRIRAALPTIKYLLEHQARIVLMSHLGRPKNNVVEELRLVPVAQRLSQILGQPVATTADCIGPEVVKAVAALKPGEIIMLENLRFHAGEEAGDPDFAKALADLGDIYIDDAFGVAHRAHASISSVAKYLPAVAGFLLEKEINTLGGLLDQPAHPFISIFGGAKVSDKVAVLNNIMSKVDCLLIGGGMAATFLKAHSCEVGRSFFEADIVATAAGLIKETGKSGVRLLLPVDIVVAYELNSESEGKVVPANAVPVTMKIADIGPETIRLFRKEIERSKTIFWNGPMGVAEIPQFAVGTHEIATLISRSQATTVTGGGSTAEVIDSMGLKDKVTFVSTGGGASLEFLGGVALPGVVALKDKK